MAENAKAGTSGSSKKLKLDVTTQKRASSIPLSIVEDHNDALPRIYRLIGSKRLPYDGLKMLHFDSHPDLLLPKELLADDVFNPQTLYEKLSIENWILPAFYAGHFEEIVWVKAEWAKQIPDGLHKFHIGKDTNSGQLKVSSTVNYFLSELLYSTDSNLTNKKPVTLTVKTLSMNHSGSPNPSDKSNGNKPEQETSPYSLNSTPFVLDIDLDFYSTANPFLGVYPGKQYELIKKLYRYQPPVDESESSVSACVKSREEQLSYLNKIFSTLSTGGDPKLGSSTTDNLIKELLFEIRASKAQEANNKESQADTSTSTQCKDTSVTNIPIVSRTEEEVENARPEAGEGSSGGYDLSKIDFSWVHEVGCGVDDTELPHHISTNEEIDSLVSATETFLSRLPKPAAITIARSSEDDYCPPHQVDSIQEKVLAMLSRVYGDLNISKHY